MSRTCPARIKIRAGIAESGGAAANVANWIRMTDAARRRRSVKTFMCFPSVPATQLDTAADRQQHRIEFQLTDATLIVRGVRSRDFRINHVVRGNIGPARQFGVYQLEAGDIQILPQIDKHEIKRPRET